MRTRETSIIRLQTSTAPRLAFASCAAIFAIWTCSAGCVAGPNSPPLLAQPAPSFAPGRAAILPVSAVDLDGRDQVADLRGVIHRALAHVSAGAPHVAPAAPDRVADELRRAGYGELLKRYAANTPRDQDAELFSSLSSATRSVGYDTVLRTLVRARSTGQSRGDQLGIVATITGTVEVTILAYRAGETTAFRFGHGNANFEYSWGRFAYVPFPVGNGPGWAADHAAHHGVTELYAPASAAE